MQKAIFTLCTKFNTKKPADTGGFLCEEDYACSIILSIMLAKENIGRVEVFTDQAGKSLLESLGLPVDKYHLAYDVFDYPHPLWVVSKLMTFAVQETPFIHFDLDAYLWSPLPARLLGAAIVAQSSEENWGSYVDVLKYFMEHVKWVPEFIRKHWEQQGDKIYAVNAGAYGGNDIKTIQFVSKAALQTIDHPDNQPMFAELEKNNTSSESIFWHYPIVLEQYYMGVYCHQFGIDLRYVDSTTEPPYFTHLMAESKRHPGNSVNLKDKVRERYPYNYSRIPKRNV